MTPIKKRAIKNYYAMKAFTKRLGIDLDITLWICPNCDFKTTNAIQSANHMRQFHK